jgi:hypothetical protein
MSRGGPTGLGPAVCSRPPWAAAAVAFGRCGEEMRTKKWIRVGGGSGRKGVLFSRNAWSAVGSTKKKIERVAARGLKSAQEGMRNPGPGPGCGLGAGEAARGLGPLSRMKQAAGQNPQLGRTDAVLGSTIELSRPPRELGLRAEMNRELAEPMGQMNSRRKF